MLQTKHEWFVIFRSSTLAFLSILLFAIGARFILDSTHKLHAPSAEAAVISPFLYTFNDDGTLHETARMNESSSPYWWLSSGGKLIIDDGTGATVKGRLGPLDRWRLMYARSSSRDTERGYKPQNLFRLVSKSSWDDARVEASFKILGDNFSQSENNNASNGLFLMLRYKDSDNLYYAGVRVDGHAVIKKKHKGAYQTLAEKPVFTGAYADATNLLPHDEWIRLRADTIDEDDATVIRLYVQKEDGEWKHLLTTRDTHNPITSPGHIGIRTDFMDVEFDDIKVENL